VALPGRGAAMRNDRNDRNDGNDGNEGG
jgi:hypothetical protein